MNSLQVLILVLSILSIPITWRRKVNGEFSNNFCSLISRAPKHYYISVPWMPPRTSGCSQKCSAEYHSSSPLPPMSEPRTLILLLFSFIVPITRYLSSLCSIFHCSLPLVLKAHVTYRTYTVLCPLVFTMLQTSL